MPRAEGGKNHGVFELCYSKCVLRTGAGPNCSFLVCVTTIIKSERAFIDLTALGRAILYLLILNNQTLDLYCVRLFLFHFSKNSFVEDFTKILVLDRFF